jgi:hypothetical protein
MSRTMDRALTLVRSAQGPIAPHIEAFAASLIAQRYSTFCVHHKVYWRPTITLSAQRQLS